MIKRLLGRMLSIESHIRGQIRVSTFFWRKVPLLGKPISLILDRLLLWCYAIDLQAHSIRVAQLAISHPGGVLLGGNGVVSTGRVAIMAGVKLVARSPSDPEYLRRQATREVFRLGDNVVIGANAVVIGPIDICDNVVIGAMSLVNKSITEPGVYVGTPVRRIADVNSDEWVAHLPKI